MKWKVLLLAILCVCAIFLSYLIFLRGKNDYLPAHKNQQENTVKSESGKVNNQASENLNELDYVLQGRFEFLQSLGVVSPLKNAYFESNDNHIVYCSGMDYAPCNGILDNSGKATLTKDLVLKTVNFFKGRNLPFIWWSSDKNLEQYNFQYGGILTGIIFSFKNDSSIMDSTFLNKEIKVKMIEAENDIKMFSDIGAKVLNRPELINDFFQLNLEGHKKGGHIHFIAYVDGAPVGTVTLARGRSTIGIWNLTTLPEFRKRGVGTALIYSALLQAKKLNYDKVMAILMPKGMAWGIFTKLGFKEICQFPFYVYGVNADELEK